MVVPHSDAVDTVPSDPRLVVVDLDGTLLDEDGAIPTAFWPILDRLRAREITFAVASGRQYAALTRLFERDPHGIAFIAENGAYVARDDLELGFPPVERPLVERLVATFRRLAAHRTVGLVWSGRHCAYVEARDPDFLTSATTFFPALQVVDDLLAVAEEPLKFSGYDHEGAEQGLARDLAGVTGPYRAVVSSPNWIDVMHPGINKGVAVAALRDALGVSRNQTMAFGDYLNDLEMLDEAGFSYAMANAHPEVLRRARFVAPSNGDSGVVRTLARVLGDDRLIA